MDSVYDTPKLVEIYNQGRTEPECWFGMGISRPTKQSIETINKKLAIELPQSLIYFAENCMSNELVASLGEDFSSPWHIIQLNKEVRKIRRRVIGGRGKWDYVFPNHFVVFNLGHDNDWECFDLNKKNQATGEYSIQYWAPPRIFGATNPNFPSYLASVLKFRNIPVD